ncbi:DUF2750 domain-containing protein [Terriglobus albidus]|uniref:DUF2750 domain-containing protein n=1 Tax=Terriglobus albidus TaxID=1592106 RepID=UPI0021E09748|nr:DUF2750 domain-containing protein [Terriglobus albidus]
MTIAIVTFRIRTYTTRNIVSKNNNRTDMYKLNDKHLRGVLEMAGPERYSYFIKRVADWQFIYALESPSGWALAGDETSFSILPVWPHKRFAEICIKGDWSDCVVTQIPLSEWMPKMTQMLEAKQIKVAVFPLPDGRGVVVESGRLSADISEELAKVEDG